ncbi:hypothetical protein IFM89_016853, partial [Coptis chinensis]
VFQGYVVFNRPWAFVQWLEKATFEEDISGDVAFSASFVACQKCHVHISLELNFLNTVHAEKKSPTWMNVSISMKNDPEIDKTFGWVLEM